jgi:phosphatidylglycerol:prolipoprotein diacylglycerol transferase
MKLLNHRLLALHPVQLYSAAAALAIFLTLLIVRKRQKKPGFVTALFALLYASARFFLEFFRGDTQALIGIFTMYQLVCAFLFLAGVGFWIHLVRTTRD